METRIYSNQELSLEAYHASEGLSNSGVKEIERSPLHYWTKYLDPQRELAKKTPAKIIGSAFHCLLGEPENFDKQFCTTPKKADFPDIPDTIEEITAFASKRGISLPKLKKDAMISALREKCHDLVLWDEHVQIYTEGRTVLTQEQFDSVRRMHDAVMKHPAARVLFRKGWFERSFYWRDPLTDTLYKTRPDWVSEDGVIVDPKTTEDARPDDFVRDAWNFGYHVQASMALDGVKVHMPGIPEVFINMAIEKEPPYGIYLYEQQPEEIIAGRIRYQSAGAIYSECLKTNSWPCYPPKIQPLGRPAWARGKN